jgi:adenylyltransferase/sulfurtransferase
MAQEILPQLVALKLKDKPKGFMLVDIRPADERKLTHIPGDVHIPAEKFSVDAAKYKDNDVVLYCHHGVRSAVLADALEVRGINVKSMAGGIDAWSDKVDPTVKKYGHEHN